MTPISIDDIREAFGLLTQWEDRYRFLIELGEQLPPLDADQRCEDNRVTGCMSQVWIVARPAPDAPTLIEFAADSETGTIKGLAAVLIAVYSHRRPDDILALDPDAVFEALELHEHLSPNRHVGVYAMVEHIRTLARLHAAASPKPVQDKPAVRHRVGMTGLA